MFGKAPKPIQHESNLICFIDNKDSFNCTHKMIPIIQYKKYYQMNLTIATQIFLFPPMLKIIYGMLILLNYILQLKFNPFNFLFIH